MNLLLARILLPQAAGGTGEVQCGPRAHHHHLQGRNEAIMPPPESQCVVPSLQTGVFIYAQKAWELGALVRGGIHLHMAQR